MSATMLCKFVAPFLLLGQAAAQINLTTFPSTVSVGQEYTLRWSASKNYTYTIWLVEDADPDENDSAYGWKKFMGLGTGLVFGSLNPSFSWNVPSNVSINGLYALWVNGFAIPFNGAGSAVVTDWFTVSARAASSSTSSIASATSSEPSETSAASDSNRGSADEHHNGLSGGAITGIVIGCILGIGLLIGAVLLVRKRRNRSTPESREAQARANRLAPVMQENFPGYEMETRRSRTS